MGLIKFTANSVSGIDLSDKTYLITGAANGIGRAVAIALADCNAAVILLDKDNPGLNRVYDEIAKKNSEAVIVHQDLTLLTQNHCDCLADQIQRSYGVLNGLIHCATETGHLAPIEHYSEQDWSKVMRANLHSPYLLTRSLFPLLKNDQPGLIIFSVSRQAIKAGAYWGAYAVAQQGLKALNQTWSEEIENTNIQMLMVDPGKVNTEFLVRLYPGLNPKHYPGAGTIAQSYLKLVSGTFPGLNGKLLKIHDREMQVLDFSGQACQPAILS